MLIDFQDRITHLTVRQHIAYRQFVAIDYRTGEAIQLIRDQRNPFLLGRLTIPVAPQRIQFYLDTFALQFGQRESLVRKSHGEMVPTYYGCSRGVRDEIFLLPVDDLLQAFYLDDCPQVTCQYWHRATGRDKIRWCSCLLARYRLFDNGEFYGMTLEECGAILTITREWVRKIEISGLEQVKLIQQKRGIL